MTAVPDRIEVAWSESRILAVLTEGSRIVNIGLESAEVSRLSKALIVKLQTAVINSSIINTSRVVVGRFESWLQNSVIYQRLSAEPDPTVTEIDLRQTFIGALLIGTLGSLMIAFKKSYPHSKVHFLVRRIFDDV